MQVWRPKAAHQARKDGDWAPIMESIAVLATVRDVDVFQEDYTLTRARHLPDEWRAILNDACDARRSEIRAEAAMRAMDREIGEIARHG